MAIMTKSQFTEKFGNDEHFAEWMDVIENSGDYAEMYSDTVYADDGNKAGEYEERAEAVWKNGEMFINHYVHTEDVNGYEDEADDCDEAEDAILTAYDEARYDADMWEVEKRNLWNDFM